MFKPTKKDLQKSQKCPVGMHIGTLVTVEEPYTSASKSKCQVQKCEFETKEGYIVPVWFNDAVMTNLLEFIESADNIKFSMDQEEFPEIELKNYIGKPVAFSVSHVKDDNNKIQAQIDNFYPADKVPF